MKGNKNDRVTSDIEWIDEEQIDADWREKIASQKGKSPNHRRMIWLPMWS